MIHAQHEEFFINFSSALLAGRITPHIPTNMITLGTEDQKTSIPTRRHPARPSFR